VNVEILYSDNQILTGARYVVAVGDVGPEASILTLYQAAIIRISIDGVGPIMKGPAEPTLYAAYRGLFKLTVDEIGKRLRTLSTQEERTHRRVKTLSEEIDRVASSKSFRVLGIDK